MNRLILVLAFVGCALDCHALPSQETSALERFDRELSLLKELLIEAEDKGGSKSRLDYDAVQADLEHIQSQIRAFINDEIQRPAEIQPVLVTDQQESTDA